MAWTTSRKVPAGGWREGCYRCQAGSGSLLSLDSKRRRWPPVPLQTPGTNSTWDTSRVPSKARARAGAEGKGLIHSTSSIVPRAGLTLQTEKTLCRLADMSHAGDEQRGPPLLARVRADGALMQRLCLPLISRAFDHEARRELRPSQPSPQRENPTDSLDATGHASSEQRGPPLLARGRADGALMLRLRLHPIRAAFASDASRLDAFGHAEDEQRGPPLPARGRADGALMYRWRVHLSSVDSERAASLELLTSQPPLQRARTRCSLDAKGNAGDEQRGSPLLARDRADGALMHRLRLRRMSVPSIAKLPVNCCHASHLRNRRRPYVASLLSAIQVKSNKNLLCLQGVVPTELLCIG